MKNCFLFLLPVFGIFFSCGGKKSPDRMLVDIPHLPIMGGYVISEQQDTIWHSIPPFQFVNQDGQPVSEKDFEGKVYLADFFFTTCPSICPKMAITLQLVQEKMKGEKNFGILSHTIDPEHDEVSALKEYARKQGADSTLWTFVTGNKDSIYEICENSYMAFAKPDEYEPGGFIHSGFLILVDKQKHIRAVYDGTRAEIADSIVRDVKLLLKEK